MAMTDVPLGLGIRTGMGMRMGPISLPHFLISPLSDVYLFRQEMPLDKSPLGGFRLWNYSPPLPHQPTIRFWQTDSHAESLAFPPLDRKSLQHVA